MRMTLLGSKGELNSALNLMAVHLSYYLIPAFVGMALTLGYKKILHLRLPIFSEKFPQSLLLLWDAHVFLVLFLFIRFYRLMSHCQLIMLVH